MPKSIERNCLVCHTEFLTWPYVVREGRGLYCSRKCSWSTIGRTLSARALRMRPKVRYVADYALIPVGTREWMKVSLEDADYMSSLVWSPDGKGYAVTSNLGHKTQAHRVVAERMLGKTLPISVHVDHEHHDPLDNRRSKIRPCTPSQNEANKSLTKRNTSGYKGVTRCSRTGKWRMNVGGRASTGKQIHWTRTEGDPAYLANLYDQFASQIYGDFAVLNFDYYEVPRQDGK